LSTTHSSDDNHFISVKPYPVLHFQWPNVTAVNQLNLH